MKKFIWFLILTSISYSANAAWTEIADTNIGTFYVDFATVRKDGNTRVFWRMINFKQPTSDGHLSARQKTAINCINETFRDIDFSAFTQPNLRGAMSGPYTPPPNWDHIPPRTVYASLMRAVCV